MTSKRQGWRIRPMEDHKRTYFNPAGSSMKSTLGTPMVRIEDHSSEVLSCDFHPSGKFILSSNRNGQIHICDIYGTFSKTMVLKGHRGSVPEAHFSRDGFDIYSCSTDGTIGVWDTFRGYRKCRLDSNSGGLNCIQGARIGYPVLCTGSTEGTLQIWDAREKECAIVLQTGSEVTSTCFSQNGDYAIAGGVDNDIQIWDLRMSKIICKLRGHQGKVTGIALSPCGAYLVSHSVDSTLRVWDIRPNVTFKRCVGCFASYHHTDGLLRCAWSPDGTMISAGTSVRDVYVWDTMTGEVVHEFLGHESTINDVTFHPKEPVLLSASDDSYLFMHEM